MRSKNAIKNNFSLLSQVGIVAALLLGCVSSGAKPAVDLGDDGLVVVERSKAEPPGWVTMPQGQVVESPQELRVMTVRSKLLNLPLGLRQTQLVGMDVARTALAAWLRLQLLGTVDAAAVEAVPARQELDRILRATVDGQAGSKAKINDLYYEALNNREAPPGDVMAHYYAVYILVAYPRDKLPFLFHDLAARLKVAKVPAVQRLAVSASKLEHPVQ